MTTDAIFSITQNGTITGSGHLVPGQTFTVTTLPGDPYLGSIYAIHLEHNATLELVGDGQHTIEVGKTYTVQDRARNRNYKLSTTRPGQGHNTHVHAGESPDTPPPVLGSNGDLYVGSGG
jgi:hypothetical protein